MSRSLYVALDDEPDPQGARLVLDLSHQGGRLVQRPPFPSDVPLQLVDDRPGALPPLDERVAHRAGHGPYGRAVAVCVTMRPKRSSAVAALGSTSTIHSSSSPTGIDLL